MTRPRRRVYVHLTSTGPQETPDPFERGLVGFSRCHRTSHITRTLRVEARLASLVLRHLVRGVLLAPLAVGLLRFRHLFDRETVIILGQSLRAIFARALKRAMLRARRAPRRRRRRRDDAANDDALFRSRDRSLTFTISHTLARRREAYVGAIARDLDLDLNLDLARKTILGHNPRRGKNSSRFAPVATEADARGAVVELRRARR